MSCDFTKIEKDIIWNYFIKWNNIEAYIYLQIVEFKNVIKAEFIFKHVTKKVSDTETQLLKVAYSPKINTRFQLECKYMSLAFS